MSNPYEPRPEENPYGQGGDPYGATNDPYAQQPETTGQQPQPYGQPEQYGQGDPYAQPQSSPYGQVPAYGQSPYGASSYGGTPYGVAPQPHPQGTTVLVLGIIGLVACFIPGIVAIVMGNKALKEIDANPAAYTNRQNVQVGRILGIIAVCLWGLAIVGYGIFAVAIFATIPNS